MLPRRFSFFRAAAMEKGSNGELRKREGTRKREAGLSFAFSPVFALSQFPAGILSASPFCADASHQRHSTNGIMPPPPLACSGHPVNFS